MPIPLQDIELRPPEVQEILNKPPNFLLRSGPTLLLSFTILIMMGAYLIKYPDIVEGEFVLIPSEEAQLIQAPMDGRLLNPRQTAEIDEGDILFSLESTDTVLTTPVLAPVTGNLLSLSFMDSGLPVQKGDSLFLIVPPSDHYTGLMEVSEAMISKIKQDQKVIIQFRRYPVEDFGFVEGKVKRIAPLSQNGTYRVQIALPHGLQTPIGRELAYFPNLLGSAKIVTEDLRLSERLFSKYKKYLQY